MLKEAEKGSKGKFKMQKREAKGNAEKGSKGKLRMFDKKNALITTSITRIQNQMVVKMNMNILSGQARHTV